MLKRVRFRWAYCQLQSLKRVRASTLRIVRDHLAALPKTLDEAYERMLVELSQLSEDEQRIACTALQWLVVQCEPLKINDLIEVILSSTNLCRLKDALLCERNVYFFAILF